MAVAPLKKTKIIKKRVKHSNRFQSDMRHRVGVSSFSWKSQSGTQLAYHERRFYSYHHGEQKANLCVFLRPHGENREVWIASSGVNSEGEWKCQQLEASKQGERDTSSQVALRSFYSETNQTSSYFLCTTEPIVEKSLKVFLLLKGK